MNQQPPESTTYQDYKRAAFSALKASMEKILQNNMILAKFLKK
jgi:hypothetical protein